jgi:hypothetical protein
MQKLVRHKVRAARGGAWSMDGLLVPVKQPSPSPRGAMMFLSWKENTAIALIVIVCALLTSYFSTRPHLVSTLPGVEGP